MVLENIDDIVFTYVGKTKSTVRSGHILQYNPAVYPKPWTTMGKGKKKK